MNVYIIDQDDMKIFFGDGVLEIELCENEDDNFEYGNLSKDGTKELYKVMKEYYGEEVKG